MPEQQGEQADDYQSARETHADVLGKEGLSSSTATTESGHFARLKEKAELQKARLPELREQLRDSVKNAPTVAGDILERTRESRLHVEDRNKQRNFLQRAMSRGVGKWVVKPLIESIPSPAGYGPGDIVTAIGALRGRDILTSEQLDTMDRVIYAGASVIPFVPATYIVEPSRFIRKRIENHVYKVRSKKK